MGFNDTRLSTKKAIYIDSMGENNSMVPVCALESFSLKSMAEFGKFQNDDSYDGVQL